MNKSCKKSTKESIVGPLKLFCGRKKKFGITLHAICDHKHRFIDIELGHPASTSDYLCFITSKIHQDLQNPDFLAEDLVLFGDNAYVNIRFMATTSYLI